jgi:hypothetical protein
MRIVFATALDVAFMATPALAQERSSSIGVGVTAGSLGIGPEVNFRSDHFGVRGSPPSSASAAASTATASNMTAT